MKPAPIIIRLFAAVVALALLGTIGYLAHRLTSGDASRPEGLIAATEGTIRRHASQGIVPTQENRLSLASLPWSRDARAPEPSQLAAAAQPFIQRAGAPAAIPLAHLPPLRARHDLARPTPVQLGTAEMPWGRLRTPAEIAAESPLAVPAADLPRIRPRRNPIRPTRTELRAAELPWTRLGPAAEVKYLEPAAMPHLTARRDPAKPLPSKVPLATLPWERESQRPQPAPVDAARVPSVLKTPKPK